MSQPRALDPVRCRAAGLCRRRVARGLNAWIKAAAPAFPLCSEVRQLSIASGDEQRAWMKARLQPYRVEPTDGNPDGLLTAYYEPLMDAARQPGNGFNVPIYRTPAGFGARKPWYTRQQIETLPEAQAALQGRAIAWLRDPVESMVLHIQGSGRLQITEADGRVTTVRVVETPTTSLPERGPLAADRAQRAMPFGRAFARLAQTRNATSCCGATRAMCSFAKSPEPLDAQFGPRGAQGVPLTPGRSVPWCQSIPMARPYGWSHGPAGVGAAPGDGAGHRQRHRGRGASRLFRTGAPGGQLAGKQGLAGPVAAVSAARRDAAPGSALCFWVKTTCPA